MSITSFDDNYNKTNPYPIGSVYISINPTDPSTLFGGVWQRIEGRFLLACSDSHPQGETGGAEQVTLTLNQAPSHTHTRGTMDIKGTYYRGTTEEGTVPNNWSSGSPVSGAFYGTGGSGSKRAFGNSNLKYNFYSSLGFQASRNWTGETSPQGGNQPHDNMPPYLSVYMWYRTA